MPILQSSKEESETCKWATSTGESFKLIHSFIIFIQMFLQVHCSLTKSYANFVACIY